MKKRILAIGNIYSGVYTTVSAIPMLNGESTGTSYRQRPCGNILTAARTMAGYGLDVLLCSKIGSDPKAKSMLSYIQQLNIGTRYIKSEPQGKTGMVLHIHEEKGGDRKIVFPMSSEHLTKLDIENAFTCYPDALYLQGELTDELSDCAFKYAVKNHCSIFYQPCKKKNLLDPKKIPHLEVLILDGDEVGAYCGIDVKQYDKCLPACMALSSIYDAKYIVVRMPERGTFIYDGKYHEIIRTFQTSENDRPECKHTFGGVMCSHYMNTENIREAVCMGNIAYAMVADSTDELPLPPDKNALHRYIRQNEIKFT